MGKSKKDAKEFKAMEDRACAIKSEWAAKRGKEYPLSIGDHMQLNLEMLIQQRFCEMKNLLATGEKIPPPADPSVAYITRRWQFWTHEDADRYKVCPTASWQEVNNQEESIQKAARSGVAGNEYINFADTAACENGQTFMGGFYSISKAAFKVVCCEELAGQMYIGDGDIFHAEVYLGDVLNRKYGLFTFSDLHGSCRSVIQEFCMLSDTGPESYLFTFFSRPKDVCCNVALPRLNNIELYMEGGTLKFITTEPRELLKS